jgi:hypothetical protein
VRRCCKENVGSFFIMSSIEGCSPTTKLDSKLMAYSSYNLNTLFAKDNTLNLNDPKSGTKQHFAVKDVQTVSVSIIN